MWGGASQPRIDTLYILHLHARTPSDLAAPSDARGAGSFDPLRHFASRRISSSVIAGRCRVLCSYGSALEGKGAATIKQRSVSPAQLVSGARPMEDDGGDGIASGSDPARRLRRRRVGSISVPWRFVFQAAAAALLTATLASFPSAANADDGKSKAPALSAGKSDDSEPSRRRDAEVAYSEATLRAEPRPSFPLYAAGSGPGRIELTWTPPMTGRAFPGGGEAQHPRDVKRHAEYARRQ